MNKYLMVLFSATLAGAVGAQDPGKPVAGRPAASAATAATPSTPAARDSCPAPCTIKMCVPEPSTTKKTRVYHECTCKDYCLPRCPCPLLGWFKHGCKDCDTASCPKCSKVRTRNVLIKKVATEECDTFKCVPKEIEATPCAPVVKP